MMTVSDIIDSYAGERRLRTRPMRLTDIPNVQQIDRLSFPVPWPNSAFRFELTENKQSLTRVATLEDAGGNEILAGAIVVWMILDEAHVATLSVHPEHRRHGVASRLLADTLYLASRRGAVMATLEVRAGNVSAQGLYEKFKFQVTGRRRGYYRDNNEDALIMTVEFDRAQAHGLKYADWLARRANIEKNGGK